jgi:hypothetical protein
MYKPIVLSTILLLSLFSTVAKGDECDISGVWNHSAKPAKLFIDLSKGEISVYSHEKNLESIGLVALNSIKLGSTASTWDAKMYSAAENSFVNVQIKSISCNQLSVSFDDKEVLGLLR